MTRLEELIKKLCPNGVTFKKLEECCCVLDRQRKPVSSSARTAGDYPYYGANGIQDYVSDYIFDGQFVLVGEDGSVLTKNGTPVVTWAEGKIWVNNHAHIVSEKDGVLLRFLFHYLQTVDITHLVHGNIPKLTGGDFKALKIPVPPVEVQREIVHILDNFTKLTTELTTELTARRKQLNYYRNSLFEFDDSTERVSLGELCSIKGRVGWQRLTKLEYRNSGDYYLVTGTDFLKNNRIDFEHCYFVSKERYEQDPNIQLEVGDVILTKDGTIGKVAYIDRLPKPATLNSHLVVFKNLSSRIMPKFLMYILLSDIFLNFANNNSSKGTIIGLPQKTIAMFPMPIPSLKKQEEIVSILETISDLSLEVSDKLPAEINARQKQYYYYRNKLLTFKELSK